MPMVIVIGDGSSRTNAPNPALNPRFGGTIGGGTGVFVDWQPVLPRDIGTRLIPDPKATGESLRFQQAFVQMFSNHDPQPISRSTHFTWVRQTETKTTRRTGWCGAVREVTSHKGGGMLVKVRIYPMMYSTTKRLSAIDDYVDEIYLVNEDQLQFIDTDAALEKPHLHGVQPEPAR